MQRSDPNYMREYRRKKPEKHRAQNRANYQANKATYKERSARWKAANGDRMRELQKKHRLANSDKMKARSQAHYRANREKAAVQSRTRKLARYGMTEADYQAMVKAQGGLCLICTKPPATKLYVDHCHATGKVRGLLCSKCNAAIGMLADNPELLERAMAYLTSSSSGAISTTNSAQ